VKECDFDALRCSEAERCAGGQLRRAAEALDDARRDGAAGPEPGEDQTPMTRRLRVIFFSGSIRLRMVRVHRASRNLIAHSGLVYSQNRWKSSRSR